MMAIPSRLVLTLLLLGGALLLGMAALVERPHEESGHAAGEAVAADDAHADEPAAAAVEREGEGPALDHDEDESALATDQHESDVVLGLDLATLNLAAPRLALIVIGVSVPLALVLAFRRSPPWLVAAVGLGVGGCALSVYEAMRAGEELGIFAPLPILVAVLYSGAAGLAGLALGGSRVGSEAARATSG